MRAVSAALALVLPAGLVAQSPTLYTPRAVAKAYATGARSLDGKPGANYWQNHGKYTIAINVAPPARLVTGSEQITYFNESPDTLHNLLFRFIVNIHKAGATRAFPADDDYITSGVHVDSFLVEGQIPTAAKNPRAYTLMGTEAQTYSLRGIRLVKPLAPHDSVHVLLNWHYDLSKESNREGMLD